MIALPCYAKYISTNRALDMLKSSYTLSIISLLFLILGLSACSPGDVRQAMENQRPRISIADQRITSLDFERVSMAFGIKVDNPNPIGIQLAGLDYDLKLGGHSFLTGSEEKQMSLRANGVSRIELPLSLGFAEINEAISTLKGKEEVPYELTTGLMIEVPLLGKLRYPVTSRGIVPVPQLPKVSLKTLRVDSMNLLGATLALDIEVDNPNAFSLGLDRLNYNLMVNGKRWASGNRNSLGTIKQKQNNVITLPLSLNFMELGSGLYTALSSGKEVNYSLSGKLDASSSNKLLGSFAMPFETDGRVSLSQ